ncbi:MAG: PaaI family thioesterase [Pseudobdellovibrionaceae bacterium]
MNQQWLTILMSKGIELEQSLRQQLESAKKGIKSELEERGIRLSATDVAALLEEYSPKVSHAALSYAIDLIRPFSAGMGLRISRLSDSRVEMVIPARTRNLNESGFIHEGAILTAALESAKLLWMRHAPLGHFEINVCRTEIEFFKSHSEDCRVRMELPETVREVVLAEVRDHRESQADAELKVFDGNDQTVAEVRLSLKFKHTPAIAE